MAGHSKFKNIMHRKGAQDKKRAKIFTKVIREIIVAARNGLPDPQLNPRLRVAVLAARDVNMPKDKVENAIKKATSHEAGDHYEEIRYEGYGPYGTAFIVEALSDNRNRTASEIRSAFNKYGGTLGETGSVSYMFKHLGIVVYALSRISYDDILEASMEAGAEDCIENEGEVEIITNVESFHIIKDKLEANYGEPTRALLEWKPTTTVELDLEAAQKIMRFIEALEDSDDVQNVTSNFTTSDEVLKKLAS